MFLDVHPKNPDSKTGLGPELEQDVSMSAALCVISEWRVLVKINYSENEDKLCRGRGGFPSLNLL